MIKYEVRNDIEKGIHDIIKMRNQEQAKFYVELKRLFSKFGVQKVDIEKDAIVVDFGTNKIYFRYYDDNIDVWS